MLSSCNDEPYKAESHMAESRKGPGKTSTLQIPSETWAFQNLELIGLFEFGLSEFRSSQTTLLF